MEDGSKKAPNSLRKRVIFDQCILVSFFYWPLQIGLIFLISSFNEIAAQEITLIFLIKLIAWAVFNGLFIGVMGCLFSLLGILLIAIPSITFMVIKDKMSCLNMMLLATFAGMLMSYPMTGGDISLRSFLYWSVNGTIIGAIVYWLYYSPARYSETLRKLKKGT